MFDYIAVSGSAHDRIIEYVDHIHERFVDPVVINAGRYWAPTLPGSGAQMHAASLAQYSYPDGSGWLVQPASQVDGCETRHRPI